MKNITISVDDDVYHQARIKAAEQDTSVSALVKNYLVDLINATNSAKQSEFDRRSSEEHEIRRRLFAAGQGLRPISANLIPKMAHFLKEFVASGRKLRRLLPNSANKLAPMGLRPVENLPREALHERDALH